MAKAKHTAAHKPSGAGAVMSDRRSSPDGLDFFPTPPWATRALLQVVLAGEPLEDQTCWEPAAGEGHMALVLAERFGDVYATDVHDYGALDKVGSFLGGGAEQSALGLDVIATPPGVARPDWIITNPPFHSALEFAERAIADARIGAALLVRVSWLAGGDRYTRLFAANPPSLIAYYAERVPMVAGRWDPDASTATDYCWVVWHRGWLRQPPLWIPPGQRKALTRASDRVRFVRPAPIDVGTSPAGGLL